MLQKLFDLLDEGEVIDPDTGEPYQRYTGIIKGQYVEVHKDLVEGRDRKYHARANKDPSTTGARLDESGLVGWFLRMFGG